MYSHYRPDLKNFFHFFFVNGISLILFDNFFHG